MSSGKESKKAPSVELYFSYFIGRCNPPHQGHFHMINEAITAAREKSGKALILLGSGPKAKIGIDRRTKDDPLIFDLKKEIIEKNIYCVNDESVKDENQKQGVELESVILEEPNYEIVEKTNPTTQVIEFVETKLKTYADNTPFKITVQHFCGEKELADKNKMRFYEAIQTILTERISSDYNNVEIVTGIKEGNVPNEAGASMSATEIRTTAFRSEEDFQYYSCIYGEDTKRVYEAIIEGKQIGEKTLKDYTDSKTRKENDNSTDSRTRNKKTCRSTGSKNSACNPKPKPKTKSGGKRKTNKRKTNKRKINKRRKTNKRKKRKTKRTNKRKNDLNK